MKYFKVKKTSDQVKRITDDNKNNGIFVENELYTEKELKRFKNGIVNTDIVNINKNNTYFFFGCRFAAE